jgi:Pvc16 N-terminal domain
MIDDVDKTIAAFLKTELPPDVSKRLAITFLPTDGSFPSASIALPAVNLFLYGVSESVDFRDNAPVIQRLPDGTATQGKAPVYLDCSYLVTVWPDPKIADPIADEHAILGAVTKVLLAHPQVPDGALQGALPDAQTYPVAAKLTNSDFKSPAEIWQSLGGRQKLFLNYRITFAMPVVEPTPTPLVTDKQIRFSMLQEVSS